MCLVPVDVSPTRTSWTSEHARSKGSVRGVPAKALIEGYRKSARKSVLKHGINLHVKKHTKNYRHSVGLLTALLIVGLATSPVAGCGDSGNPDLIPGCHLRLCDCIAHIRGADVLSEVRRSDLARDQVPRNPRYEGGTAVNRAEGSGNVV